MRPNRHNRIVEMSGMRRQRGVALVIALLLFLVVTIVGIAGIRGTILQERMAGGAYDREIGFQAAEAALMLGAQDFLANRSNWDDTIDVTPALDCSNQTCAPNPSGTVANGLWSSIPDGDGATQFSAMDDAIRPQFLIQRLGACSEGGTGGNERYTPTTVRNEGGSEDASGGLDDVPRMCYRITARALDPTAAANAERAQVFLQATYRM